MSPPRHRWLTGCGVGCAVLLLLGIAACVAGALYLRHTFRGIEKANESHEALVSKLGAVEKYVPPLDGVPGPRRMELFLSVREATEREREKVEDTLARLPPAELQEGSAIGRIRVGLGVLGDLIDAMGTYLQTRDRALAEGGMGAGEYVYLYTLVYHSWLGHEPGEAVEAPAASSGTRVRVRIDAFDDNALFGEDAVGRRYRRYVLGMLDRQLSALESADGSEVDASWLAALRKESHQMEVDPGRVLWRGRLPADVEAGLEPFRDRAEAAWSPGTNRLELPLADHEAPWQWE